MDPAPRIYKPHAHRGLSPSVYPETTHSSEYPGMYNIPDSPKELHKQETKTPSSTILQ